MSVFLYFFIIFFFIIFFFFLFLLSFPLSPSLINSPTEEGQVHVPDPLNGSGC